MSKLNKDILFLIFEELQDDSKSLFSCLMVNRLWCETVVPVLWRSPWSYSGINYSNKISLFNIIASYLSDSIKDFITNQDVQLPSGSDRSLLFDYLSFCRSIDVTIINGIISIGSPLSYNRFFIQEEFYYLMMRKCPELKYLDMRLIKHQLFYFPEAKVRLESLCELNCDTSIDSSYFYGLSRLCQYIQILIVANTIPNPNDGIVKLIEVQKNLKHFEWKDDFYDEYFTDDDPYEKFLRALEKKAENINHLKIFLQFVDEYEHILFQNLLIKFHKLKTLEVGGFLFFTQEQLKRLKMVAYNKLETIKVEHNEFNKLNFISSIVENGGKNLKRIIFRPNDTEFEYYNFKENSLNFTRKLCENCPSIEYLSISFYPSKENFNEFEKLLRICQNLKSLLIVILNTDKVESSEEISKNGEKLLEILIRSASANLKEIRFYDDFKFSLKILEEFLEKWRGRSLLSIFTSDFIYEEENYKKLISKYKLDGVIKDFKYISNEDEIYCDFSVL
jgi:hypothetical protein